MRKGYKITNSKPGGFNVFRNKYIKAFTLVEILAVIVILAIILVIAVPQINKVITNSKKEAFVSDTKIVLSQLDYKLIDRSIDITRIDETNIKDNLGIKDINYEEVTITKIKGDPYVLIKGKGKFEGLMAYGTYGNVIVSNNTTYDTVLKQMGGITQKSK